MDKVLQRGKEKTAYYYNRNCKTQPGLKQGDLVKPHQGGEWHKGVIKDKGCWIMSYAAEYSSTNLWCKRVILKQVPSTPTQAGGNTDDVMVQTPTVTSAAPPPHADQGPTSTSVRRQCEDVYVHAEYPSPSPRIQEAPSTMCDPRGKRERCPPLKFKDYVL